MPNRQNFGCRLFTEIDLYVDGSNGLPGCGGEKIEFSQALLFDSPKYLTGDEQKEFCNLVRVIAQEAVPDSAYRCVILEQEIEEIVPPEGDCTHKVTVLAELSTDKFDIADTILDALNSNTERIVTTLTDSGTISGICGIEETVEVCLASIV